MGGRHGSEGAGRGAICGQPTQQANADRQGKQDCKPSNNLVRRAASERQSVVSWTFETSSAHDTTAGLPQRKTTGSTEGVAVGLTRVLAVPLWLRLAGPASTAELCCSKLHLANYCKNASIDNKLAACCHSHAGASVPTGYRRKVQCIQTAVNSPHTIDTNNNPQSTHPVS